jgi:hypothetical protein
MIPGEFDCMPQCRVNHWKSMQKSADAFDKFVAEDGGEHEER